ncbi:unnamed protein product [Rhizophagus irregularis]|nr:unnamed protein product [Rhizophagus irregularis]
MGQHLRNNFIINNLLLMKSYNFSIEFNKHNIGKNSTVLGRGRHIMEIVGTESFLKNIKILRMNNLYFLDQFLSPDNKTLLTWWNIKNKIFALSNNRNSNVVNTPNIYKKIQSLVTTNGKNYNVKEEYIDNNVVTNLGGYEFLPINIHINNIITSFNMFHFENIYGKIIEEKPFTYIFEHFKRISNTSEINLFIKVCNGCEYNIGQIEGKCIIESMKTEIYEVRYKRLIKWKGYKAYLLKEAQHNYMENIIRYDQFFKRNPLYYSSYDNYQLHFDENSLDIIEKYIDLSLDKQKLFDSRKILYDSNVKDFVCYTDGSIKDITKEYVSATFGTTFYNLSLQKILELISSYNNWISSTRAEIFALLITLLIAPSNSNLTVYTDSASVISNFEKFKFYNFTLVTRQIFKISNNNILWKIIMDIIKENNLSVNIFKVNAHTDDSLNNYVDNIVSLAHNDQNLGINLNYNNFYDLPWIPKWNGIVIEKSLRKLITLTTNTKNLERFCPMCEEDEEDFNHIWFCEERREDMDDLISGVQNWLLLEINKILDPINHITLEHIKNLNDIWKLEVSEDHITFIDLIKGFFPCSLINFFKQLLSTKSKVEILSYNFRNEILDKSMIFWKVRCNKLNEIDRGLGIDKNVKKQHFGKEQFIDKTRKSKNKKYFNLQSLQSHIYFGGNTIDYYNIVDYGSVS